jgi:hypothetical protein
VIQRLPWAGGLSIVEADGRQHQSVFDVQTCHCCADVWSADRLVNAWFRRRPVPLLRRCVFRRIAAMVFRQWRLVVLAEVALVGHA